MTIHRSPTELPARLVDVLQHQIATWGDEVPDAASLIQQVQCYWDKIEAASVVKPLLDCDVADKIRNSLAIALQEFDAFSLDDKAWIAAAVFYFIQSDDDEHDFDSPVGFDDDAEVVSAVMAMIGRQDLVI